ncbi:MAG: hypothetical protein OXH79_23220 [Boseongicola sp.]|nr:hypothetical protein [Boseongicola sp.]
MPSHGRLRFSTRSWRICNLPCGPEQFVWQAHVGHVYVRGEERPVLIGTRSSQDGDIFRRLFPGTRIQPAGTFRPDGVACMIQNTFEGFVALSLDRLALGAAGRGIHFVPNL